MYGPPGYESKPPESKYAPILKILFVVFLLFVLLFIITKFSYISCNDIPGWCPVYCSIAGRDRIAIVSSSNGSGDNDLLYSRLIGQSVPPAYLDLYNQLYREKALSLDHFDLKESSSVLLSKYNLLIFTHADQVSPSQLQDITGYIAKGGKVIITGNSLSKVQFTQRDLDALATANKSLAGAYEKALKNSQKNLAFGDVGKLGGFSYIGEASGPIDFVIADDTYVPLRGFQNKISGVQNYTRVNYNSGLRVPAFLTTGGDDRDPAIIESKIGSARIVYVAFPLEEFPSPILSLNLIDYYTPCSFR